MLGIRINIPDGAVFDHLACVHDGNLITGFRNNAQIVRYEDHGHLIFADQAADDLQHLCLNGHVKSRGGLVRDQDLGVAEQGHRDDGALLHAAGELVRVVVDAVSCHADSLQHLSCHFHGRLLAQLLVLDHDLRQLLADGHDGVQRSHGILENHRDAVAAHFLIFLVGVVDQVFPLKEDFTVQNDSGRIGNQLHHRERHSGLSGAGLAHKTQNLALLQVEIHAIDGLHVFRVRDIMDAQIFDF